MVKCLTCGQKYESEPEQCATCGEEEFSEPVFNRMIISGTISNYHECVQCAKPVTDDVVKLKTFGSYRDAQKIGWIFDRNHNQTVAYCPTCARLL